MEIAVSAIAAILTTAAFIPQAYKIIQSRETSGVSLGMHITFAAGVSRAAIQRAPNGVDAEGCSLSPPLPMLVRAVGAANPKGRLMVPAKTCKIESDGTDVFVSSPRPLAVG